MDFKKCKTAQVLYKVRYNLQLGNVQRIFIFFSTERETITRRLS